jgi:hypothetical protein
VNGSVEFVAARASGASSRVINIHFTYLLCL